VRGIMMMDGQEKSWLFYSFLFRFCGQRQSITRRFL
jgi:hypothetical protein